MTSKITYNGELRTTAVHLRSGTTVITDAPTDNHGKGEAFSPTDFVATALGSCMLTIMGIVAKRIEADITGTKVEVTKVMASNPRRIAAVEVHIQLPHDNYTDKVKTILENAARTCPVAMSLDPDLEQKVSFGYVQAQA